MPTEARAWALETASTRCILREKLIILKSISAFEPKHTLFYTKLLLNKSGPVALYS